MHRNLYSAMGLTIMYRMHIRTIFSYTYMHYKYIFYQIYYKYFIFRVQYDVTSMRPFYYSRTNLRSYIAGGVLYLSGFYTRNVPYIAPKVLIAPVCPCTMYVTVYCTVNKSINYKYIIIIQ